MVSIFFSLLMVMALLSICGEIVMRVRLTKRASLDNIAWWRRGGDEVSATYEEVFPDSRLRFLARRDWRWRSRFLSAPAEIKLTHCRIAIAFAPTRPGYWAGRHDNR
jgi:hypothetical protein